MDVGFSHRSIIGLNPNYALCIWIRLRGLLSVKVQSGIDKVVSIHLVNQRVNR